MCLPVHDNTHAPATSIDIDKWLAVALPSGGKKARLLTRFEKGIKSIFIVWYNI